MSSLISVNVQECTPATSICHNSIDRANISYLVTTSNTISNYRHDLKDFNENLEISKNEIYDYFKLRQLEIKSDYQEHSKRNQRMQDKTKLYQEAVISFGREQFENCNQSEILKSIESFSDNFESKYGCKILMTSLHLDEGHKSKDGTIEHNYHAHVLIENYSFDTHKTCLQKLDYRNLQTDLAKDFEHLGFERGKDYTALQQAENQLAKEEHRKPKMVKPVRLEHREYREVKKRQSELELENKSLKEIVKKIEAAPNQENHAQLQVDNTDKSLQILQLHEQLRLAKEQYDMERKKLKESREAKQSDYQELKKKNETLTKQLELTKENNANNYGTLWRENKALKSELQKLEENYKTARQELKDSGEAKQVDYQELKKKFEQAKEQIKTELSKTKISYETQGGEIYKTELQELNPKISKFLTFPDLEYSKLNENKTLQSPLASETAIENLIKNLEETAYKIQEIQNPKYVDKIVEIEKRVEKQIVINVDENQRLKEGIKKHKAETNKLHNENSTLKIENEALLTTVERFCKLPAMKCITDDAKTHVERLNELYLQLTEKQDLAIVSLNLTEKQIKIIETLEKPESKHQEHVVDWENGVLKSFKLWSDAKNYYNETRDHTELLCSDRDIKDFLAKHEVQNKFVRIKADELESLQAENNTLKKQVIKLSTNSHHRYKESEMEI